jgi:hypothetical protein
MFAIWNQYIKLVFPKVNFIIKIQNNDGSRPFNFVNTNQREEVRIEKLNQ